MASEKNSPWLEVGLLGGLVALGYYMWQKNQATAAAASPTIPVSPNGLPAAQTPAAPGEAVVSVPSQTLPVATVSPGIPNGIDPTVYAAVQQWAQEDGRAPVLAMAAAAVPAEYAGMNDLITNYWDKNLKPGVAQVTFWNNLRAKYDPGDAIW